MKTCPYCAEEIQDAAIVCKHCGRDVRPIEDTSVTGAVEASRQSAGVPPGTSASDLQGDEPASALSSSSKPGTALRSQPGAILVLIGAAAWAISVFLPYTQDDSYDIFGASKAMQNVADFIYLFGIPIILAVCAVLILTHAGKPTLLAGAVTGIAVALGCRLVGELLYSVSAGVDLASGFYLFVVAVILTLVGGLLMAVDLSRP